MRISLSRGLVLALLLAAGIQGALLGLLHVTAPDVDPLRVGHRFPARLTVLDDERTFDAWDRCWVAYVIDTDCHACRILADRWAAQSGLHPDGNLLWISVDGPAKTAAFAREHSIPTRWMTRIVGSERPEFSALRELGLNAVPTRLILAPGGSVREIRLTHDFPSTGELQSMCTEVGGGPEARQEP